MSPRSLFNIILKVLGILMIRDILIVIPSLFTAFSFLLNSSVDWNTIVFFVFSISLYSWTIYMLIFRTDWIIDIFRLDQNFKEENLTVNMHRSSVLKIALIITGGLLVIDALPDLCTQIYSYWQQKKFYPGFNTDSFINILIPVIKLVIGLLLLAGTNSIVNFIERKRRS